MNYVTSVARGLVGENQRIQNPNASQAQVDAAANSATKNQLQDVKNEFGLRTAFAQPDDHCMIETNHLTMSFPQHIHVYKIDKMLRGFDANNNPLYIKKQADKMLFINVHTASIHFQGLQARQNDWVTDGDLIWSISPLFHTNQADQAPGRVTFPNPLKYENEMGTMLDIERVDITFVRTLNLNQSVGTLFFDTTAPTYDDSVPGI
jgi:hypothetical protein